MKKYFRRLYMKTDRVPFSPFLHVFVLKALAFGIMFTYFSYTEGVEKTKLFQLTTSYLPDYLGNLWGILMLVVVFGHVMEMLFRGRWYGSATAILGFMLWLYAGFIYASTGQFFAFFGIVVTDIFFWVWYYFSAVNYRRALALKILPPVS